jgi:arginine-glutamic acid dipeptide repeat-containing protein
VSLFKKKRERAESPSESLTTDSGSVADEGEAGEGEGGREASPAPTQIKTDEVITDEATDSNLSLPPPLVQEERIAFIKSEDPIFEPVIPKKEVEGVKEEEEEKVMVPSPLPQPVIDEKMPVSPPPQCKADDLFSLSNLPKAFEDIPSPGKITVKKEALFDTESVVMPVSVETFGVSKEEPQGGSSEGTFGPPPVKLEPEESSNTETSQEGVPLSQEQPPPSPLLLPVYPPPSESPLGEDKGSPPGQSVLVPPYPPPQPPPVEQDKPPTPQHSFSPFYHPHFHKPSSTYFNSLQSEPQNLKIKQEVLAPDQSQPPATDPLQSLKEVKVPGYSGTSISQPLLPTPAAASVPQGGERAESASSPFPPIESIKKEQPEYSGRASTPGKSPRPPQAEQQPSPSFPPPPSIPSSSSASSVVAPSPSRVSPAHLPHPHPFVPAMHHPHHPLIHHSLFAAAAAHAAAVHSPYHHHPYPYPYPFPYGPYPIPQPIPPPSRSHHDSAKSAEGTTIMTSHHSSSSSVTTRSVREESREDEITHHSSHHSSHQSTTSLHQGEKQPHPLTISHSTSSSSSSVQHKITSAKRTNSPHLPQVTFFYSLL